MFGDLGSFKEARLSMDHFREWANVIANSYLTGGVEPTTTLCKIAQSEDLRPSDIDVLAAEANKVIHGIKYGSEKEKYNAANFPLADAKLAISRVQVDGGSVKTAVDSPEPKFTREGPDPYEMFGVKQEVMDKTAGIKSQLKFASEKGKLLTQKLQDQVIMAKFAADAAEKTFIKQARQMAISETSSTSRMKVLGNLDKMFKVAKFSKARPTLAKLASVLVGEGLLEPISGKAAIEYFMSKVADQKAPQELISDFLQAKVVNGNHPLYITLKTFIDKKNDFDSVRSKYQVVNDQLNLVSQKIRAL
jgi:hypothetical protein